MCLYSTDYGAEIMARCLQFCRSLTTSLYFAAYPEPHFMVTRLKGISPFIDVLIGAKIYGNIIPMKERERCNSDTSFSLRSNDPSAITPKGKR